MLLHFGKISLLSRERQVAETATPSQPVRAAMSRKASPTSAVHFLSIVA